MPQPKSRKTLTAEQIARQTALAATDQLYLQFGTDRDYVFCVESEFFMTDVKEKLRGFFLLLPDPASLSGGNTTRSHI